MPGTVLKRLHFLARNAASDGTALQANAQRRESQDVRRVQTPRQGDVETQLRAKLHDTAARPARSAVGNFI